MNTRLLLLLGLIIHSSLMSIFLLHKKSLSRYQLFESFNNNPIIDAPHELLLNNTQTQKGLDNSNSTTLSYSLAPSSESDVGTADAGIDIETILIVATAPYDTDHAMALWTHLECVIDGIDRVVISAPNTTWSRAIVSLIIEHFQQQLLNQQQSSSGNNATPTTKTTVNIEAAYFTNNRYDVGLWCDGLSLHLGFNGDQFSGSNDTTTRPRAIYLINDSSVALRKYNGLTEKIVSESKMEASEQQNNNTVKLVSLNGHLVIPGDRDPKFKHYWVESVYRGLTPGGISTFYQHSCTPKAERACVGKTGNGKKRCIVYRYEMSLAREFDIFGVHSVDAMYPTYKPEQWDTSAWEVQEGWRYGRIGPKDQWIDGRRFYRYLLGEHDFPFRKLKWPSKGGGNPPKSQCLELLDGPNNHKEWFDALPFPTVDEFTVYQEVMLKSESTL